MRASMVPILTLALAVVAAGARPASAACGSGPTCSGANCDCGERFEGTGALSADITCAATSGANVGLFIGDGAVLDGAGHVVRLNGNATGSAAARDKGVVFCEDEAVVTHLAVRGFHWGVDFRDGASGNVLMDARVDNDDGRDGVDEGVHFGTGSSDNIVTCSGSEGAGWCVIEDHFDADVYVVESTGNIVSHMTVGPPEAGSGGEALQLQGANNTFTENVFLGRVEVSGSTPSPVTGNCFGARNAQGGCIAQGENVVSGGNLAFREGASNNTVLGIDITAGSSGASCIRFTSGATSDTVGNVVRRADLHTCNTHLRGQGNSDADLDSNTFHKGCCTNLPDPTVVEQDGGEVDVVCSTGGCCDKTICCD